MHKYRTRQSCQIVVGADTGTPVHLNYFAFALHLNNPPRLTPKMITTSQSISGVVLGRALLTNLGIAFLLAVSSFDNATAYHRWQTV